MKHDSLERIAAELLDGRDEVTIAAAMAPQQPDRLIGALLREARDRYLPVRLLVGDTTGTFAFLSSDDERALRDGSLRIVTLAGGVPTRLSQLVDAIPASMWDVDRLLGTGELACDVFAVRAALAAEGDRSFDLGNAVAYSPTLLARPDVALGVEVTPAASCVTGLSHVDPALWARAHIWHDERPSQTPRPVLAPADAARGRAERRMIAAHVAGLVPAGATVQIGIGALSEAIVRALAATPDLGVHSGMLPNSLREALAEGRYPATAKAVDAGLSVGTALAPDSGGAPWPASVRLRPLSETHAAAVLARHTALWAINSAFSVDLGGQVNAEWAGRRRVASGGGQTDFMRAAHASQNGGAVIALPARTSRGESRIVAAFPAATEVTTSAGDVDYVVTEYGVARLAGRTRTERAAALSAIAHPDDRRSLREAETPMASGRVGGSAAL